MSPLLTTVMGVVAVTALALDYMRERRLEEATVARLDGELAEVRRDLHEQTRRMDAAFVAIEKLGDPGGDSG